MTLNITTAARWLMSQSSDFRLTAVDVNKKRFITSDTAQKQIVLHYPNWSGLVCYTGIASFDDGHGFKHDTAAWLQQVLEHEPGQKRSTEDVVDLLIREGNTWIGRIPDEYRWHTFTMIAYDEKNVPSSSVV